MANVLHTLKRFIFTYDWEVVEIQGAVTKMLWGLWLLMPFQTFRAIEGYAAVGKENTWGWGLLIFGSIHFVAIASGRRRPRQVLTFIAFLFWLFTVLLIYQQSHTAGVLPFFIVMAFFMGVNFIRITNPLKTIDRRMMDKGFPNHVVLPDSVIEERRVPHD